jgi:TPR repeat protein
MKYLLFTAILTLTGYSFCQGTSQELYNKGQQAWENGDYKLWYQNNLDAAQKGHPEALLNVAFALDPYFSKRFPFPVEKDAVKAFEFYKKSADAGSREGAYMTGDLYRLGEGTTKNVPEAINYFKKAYELGHPKAANTLYQLMGNADDYIGFLQECIGRKNYAAAEELAIIYISGEIVQADISKAMKCLEAGEKANHGGCLYVMGYLYRNGFKKSPDGIVTLNNEDADIEKAVYYYNLAGKNGSTNALNNLGEMYLQGMEVKQDFELSFSNFEKSCNLENGYACYMCGMMIAVPYVTRDASLGEEFSQKAIKLGYQPE